MFERWWENKNRYIYRMYVILKMIVDYKLKNYGKFDWMYDNLKLRIKHLKKIKK